MRRSKHNELCSIAGFRSPAILAREGVNLPELSFACARAIKEHPQSVAEKDVESPFGNAFSDRVG
jgi:hypothetical protein